MTNQRIDGRTNKFNVFHSNFLEDIEDEEDFEDDEDDDGDEDD